MKKFGFPLFIFLFLFFVFLVGLLLPEFLSQSLNLLCCDPATLVCANQDRW